MANILSGYFKYIWLSSLDEFIINLLQISEPTICQSTEETGQMENSDKI